MAELKIHPTAARFPKLEGERFDQLVASIKANGLQQPIVLTWDGKVLIDGINRHRACMVAKAKLKSRRLPKTYTEAQIINFIINANLNRRDLEEGQRALLTLACSEDIEKAAKERQREGRSKGGKTGGRGRPIARGSREPKAKERSAADEIAKRAHVSRSTINRAKKIEQSAPALAADVISGKVQFADAYKQVSRAQKAQLAREAKEQPLSKTHVILKTYLGDEVPYVLPKGKATFNETNDQVSWAAWTWNPVTGCLHNCKYCYAREGAEVNKNLKQFYPVGFTPLFHHERLDAPANTKVPKDVSRDPRLGRVFVCSMADLYGKWVPQEWIDHVHAKMIANRQWEYLTLTKFPQRYVGLTLPPTAWIGTTVDEQYRVKIAEEAFRKISNVRLKWLSLEPLREDLEFTDLSMFDWVVIGAQSATEQPSGPVAELRPKAEWVIDLTNQAHEAGCRVYWKPNLLGIPNPQSPGMELIQEAPDLPPLEQSQGALALDAAE